MRALTVPTVALVTVADTCTGWLALLSYVTLVGLAAMAVAEVFTVSVPVPALFWKMPELSV